MQPRYGLFIGVVSSLLTIVALLAVLAVAGAARAQQGVPPQPDPPVADENAGAPAWPAVAEQAAPQSPDFMHIPGSAFVPLRSTTGAEYAPWGCMYITGPGRGSNYALTLPEGSVVTSLTMYFVDTSATYTGIMQFARYNDGQNGDYAATLMTSGNSGWSEVTQAVDIAIDYSDFSYVLYWDVQPAAGNTVQLCGFRIAYNPPLARINLLPATLHNAGP